MNFKKISKLSLALLVLVSTFLTGNINVNANELNAKESYVNPVLLKEFKGSDKNELISKHNDLKEENKTEITVEEPIYTVLAHDEIKSEVNSPDISPLTQLLLNEIQARAGPVANVQTVATGFTFSWSSSSTISGANSGYAAIDRIYADNELVTCSEPPTPVIPGGGYNSSELVSNATRQRLARAAVANNVYAMNDETYAAWQLYQHSIMYAPEGFTVDSSNVPNLSGYFTQFEANTASYWTKPTFNFGNATIKSGETKTYTVTNGITSGWVVDYTSTGVTATFTNGVLTVVNNNTTSDAIEIDLRKDVGAYRQLSMVYTKAGSQQLVKWGVNDPDVVSMDFTNLRYGTLEIAKMDNKGNYVADVQFKVYSDSSKTTTVGTYTTGANGKVEVANTLLPGEYWVGETSVPAHLVLDTTLHKVTIEANETTTYTQTNKWKQGYGELTKQDENGNIVKKAGAEFDLYNPSNVKIGTLTTNSNGVLKTGLLDYGKGYYFVETKAPSGYLISSEKIYFDITEDGATVKVTAKNKHVTGSITITKQDSETGSIAQGDATLIGAGYPLIAEEDILAPYDSTVIIYKKGELISKKTVGGITWGDVGLKYTDSTLTVKWTNLPLGKYSVTEDEASTGYHEDPTKHVFTLTYKDQNTSTVTTTGTSYEDVIKGRDALIKVSSDGTSGLLPYVEGAEFTYKLKSEVDLVGWDAARTYFAGKTNVLGYLITDYMPYGTYIRRETFTPANCITAPDRTVVIHEDIDDPFPDVVNDAPFKAKVKFVKQDFAAEQTVTYDYVTFKLRDTATGEFVSQYVGNKYIDEFTTTEDGTIYTNATGEAYTPLMLETGRYEIVEVKIPSGYLELSEPVYVDVNDQAVYEVNGNFEPVITVIVKNEQPTAEIQFKKSFESSGHLADEYKIAYFELRNVGVNTSAIDGTPNYEIGEVIPNPDTEDGLWPIAHGETLTISNLPISVDAGILGTVYSLQEISTSEGYVYDDTVHYFTFHQEDTVTKVYTETGEMENKLITTDIQVAKSDYFTSDILKGYEGIVFEATITGTYSDGTVWSEVRTAEVDPETGLATFKDVPYAAEVSIREIATHEDYFLSDEVVEFVVDKDLEGIGEVHTFTYANKPVPTLGTKATHINGSKTINPDIDNILIDDCDYTGVDTSLVYDKIWELRKTSTEEIVLTETEVGVTFPTFDGSYRVNVFVPAGTLEAGEDYYFAEYIKVSGEDIPYVEHNDPKDSGQTIHTEEPTLGTVATGLNGEKVFDSTIDNIMQDVVSYTGVDPNFIYDRVWELRESDTEKLVLEGVEKDTTFETREGKYTITVTIPANTLEDGKSYYYVEKLVVKTLDEDGNEKEEIFVEHNDPKDPGQTIHMEKPEYQIPVTKVDELTNKTIISEKFAFEFTGYKDGKLVDTFKVNGDPETGIATFTFKGAGTYDEVRIVEKEAPKGYLLSDEVVTVKMDDFNEDRIYEIRYMNTPLPDDVVVKAGDSTNVSMMIMLSSLSLLLVATYFAKKRRIQKDN